MSNKKGAKQEPKTVRESEKAFREPQVVFAFRLSEADRSLIHRAAGPGKATRFVLSAALAAAHQDSKTFEQLTAQAKANLK